MKLSTALMMLKGSPVPFLRMNLVQIAGAGVSGPQNYYFSHHQADPHHTGMAEAFKFDTHFIGAGGGVPVTGIDGQLYRMMSVHNVRMNPNTEGLDISDIPAYVLDGTGPDVMVTGQLSGCVFAIRQEAHRLLVAHVQPGNGRQDGPLLRQTIRMMGRLHHAGAGGRVTHVFGIPDYNARAHVIGVRTGGTWHIYAQCVTTGMGPITASSMII